MTCEEVLNRLDDEDCRAALLARGAAPADLAHHLASCEDCRAAWAAASEEACRFAGLLIAPLPPRARGMLLRAFPPPRPLAWARLDALTWVFACGAVGASVCAVEQYWLMVPPWIGFYLGMGCGLIGAALQSGGPGGREKSNPFRKWAVRCLRLLERAV